MTPYIGICDFPNGDRTEETVRFFQGLCIDNHVERKLMVGLMMSRKTLHGLPSKWTGIWLPNEEVYEVFVPHQLAFNTIHFADDENETTLNDLLGAVFFGGVHLNALQLDMVWPEPEMIKKFRNSQPNIKIVLQVSKKAMAQMDNDPFLVVDKLREYGDSVDYVLLDKSMGRGLEMDAYSLLPYARVIAERLPTIGLACAGGLGPLTMHHAKPLVQEFPNISIDMQGKLRRSGNAVDPIDWDLAHMALEKAVQLVR